jgi:hypothetical protein
MLGDSGMHQTGKCNAAGISMHLGKNRKSFKATWANFTKCWMTNFPGQLVCVTVFPNCMSQDCYSRICGWQEHSSR